MGAQAPGHGEPWVVKQFGDGAVSYHSTIGPVLDPRDADLKSEALARAVAAQSDIAARTIGMRCEAQPLAVAVREYIGQANDEDESVAFRLGRWASKLLGSRRTTSRADENRAEPWDDEPAESQLSDSLFARMPEAMKVMFTDCGVSTPRACDEIAGASGEFGRRQSNPIPVNGHAGEVVYIGRLLSRSGARFFWQRVGSTRNENAPAPELGLPLDVFELEAIDATQRETLFLCPYFPRRSQRTPTGLGRSSWLSMSDAERALCAMGVTGSMDRVGRFPEDLPQSLRVRAAHERVSSSVAAILFGAATQMDAAVSAWRNRRSG